MTLSIKVTASREAPPHSGGSYRHYLAGNVYGPDTDPPATLALVRRALAEGWAVAWPPEEAKVEPVVEVGDFADALRLLGVPEIRIARALADPGEVQQCDDCGLTTDDPDVMFYHACVTYEEPELPPVDPAVLMADLGPLPEGVHTLTGLPDEPGILEAAETMATLPPNSYIADGQAGEVTIRPLVQVSVPDWKIEWVDYTLPPEALAPATYVTDLQGNAIPVDGLIHGEPLRGLTDEQRAAMPRLLPQDATAPMEFAVGVSESMDGLPGPSEQLPGAYYPDGATPLPAYPPVEPIAVFDASDAIHEPPQAPPVEQAPDVPPTPGEAPKSPARKAAKKPAKPSTRKAKE